LTNKKLEFDKEICKFIQQSALKMDKRFMFDEIRKTYDTEIVPYYRKYTKIELGPWTNSQIQEHFYEHLKEPQLFISKSLDLLHKIELVQTDLLVYTDESGKRRIDERGVRTLVYLLEAQRKMLLINPTNSIAYDTELTQVLPQNRIRAKKD